MGWCISHSATRSTCAVSNIVSCSLFSSPVSFFILSQCMSPLTLSVLLFALLLLPSSSLSPCLSLFPARILLRGMAQVQLRCYNPATRARVCARACRSGDGVRTRAGALVRESLSTVKNEQKKLAHDKLMQSHLHPSSPAPPLPPLNTHPLPPPHSPLSCSFSLKGTVILSVATGRRAVSHTVHHYGNQGEARDIVS